MEYNSSKVINNTRKLVHFDSPEVSRNGCFRANYSLLCESEEDIFIEVKRDHIIDFVGTYKAEGGLL